MPRAGGRREHASARTDRIPGGGAMARLRTLLGFWLVAYGASSWRRFAYR